jgi:hypothetical protein
MTRPSTLFRLLAFGAGFFVYLTNLLCYVHAPAQMNKPLLAGFFAALALVCAIVALARRKPGGWKPTLAAILIGGALTSAVAVAAITLLRSSSAVRETVGDAQLDFTNYRTGVTVTVLLIVAGGLLLRTGRRRPASTSKP